MHFKLWAKGRRITDTNGTDGDDDDNCNNDDGDGYKKWSILPLFETLR